MSEHLGIDVKFELSSLKHKETKGLEKASRLIEIAKLNKIDNYINPKGGMDLYNKKDFMKKGVKLDFITTNKIKYPQFKNDFVPNLSIIDVMMFNSKDEIKEMLTKYSLI